MGLALWSPVFTTTGFWSTNTRDSAVQTADKHSSESEGWEVQGQGSRRGPSSQFVDTTSSCVLT